MAFDLKIGTFRHGNAGQMNFYLNYLRENVALPDELLARRPLSTQGE